MNNSVFLGVQAARQAGALGVTLVFAILAGALTGLIIRVLPSSALKKSQMYNDTDFWEDVVLGEASINSGAIQVYSCQEEQA